MERKIKEVFDYEGVSLKVVREKDQINTSCTKCYFVSDNICKRKTSIAGCCTDENRTDKTNVIFMLNNISQNSK